MPGGIEIKFGFDELPAEQDEICCRCNLPIIAKKVEAIFNERSAVFDKEEKYYGELFMLGLLGLVSLAVLYVIAFVCQNYKDKHANKGTPDGTENKNIKS